MNVAWSLSYEWMFYVVLPVAALLLGLSSWAARYRIALCLVLAVILATATFAFPTYFFLGSNPIRDCHVSIIMFLGGMVISDLMAAGVNHRRKWTDYAALVLLAAGLLVPFLYGWNNFRLTGRGPALVKNEVLIMAALFIGYGVAVYYTLTSDGFLNRFFSNAPLRWIGNMSYSFYLVHGVPMHVVAMVVARTHIATFSLTKQILFIALLFPITFLVTAIISAVVFVLVEKPFSLKPKRSAAVVRS
jgi:peptidoglycan/LPS O-acetylase OafA/YrhL